MPGRKDMAFFVSFLTLAAGALLAAIGDVLIGGCISIAGAIGALIFGDGPPG